MPPEFSERQLPVPPGPDRRDVESGSYPAVATEHASWELSKTASSLASPSTSPREVKSPDGRAEASSRPVLRLVEPLDHGFRALVQRFDLKWYGSTMGTGIVALILFQLARAHPSAQAPLTHMSYFFFFVNAVLFTAILLMTILRYVLYPRLFIFMMKDPGQSMYWGTVPMGFATLVSMSANVIANGAGAGAAVINLIWGLWWLDAVVSVGTALIVPFLLYVVFLRPPHPSFRPLSWLTARPPTERPSTPCPPSPA